MFGPSLVLARCPLSVRHINPPIPPCLLDGCRQRDPRPLRRAAELLCPPAGPQAIPALLPGPVRLPLPTPGLAPPRPPEPGGEAIRPLFARRVERCCGASLRLESAEGTRMRRRLLVVSMAASFCCLPTNGHQMRNNERRSDSQDVVC